MTQIRIKEGGIFVQKADGVLYQVIKIAKEGAFEQVFCQRVSVDIKEGGIHFGLTVSRPAVTNAKDFWRRFSPATYKDVDNVLSQTNQIA